MNNPFEEILTQVSEIKQTQDEIKALLMNTGGQGSSKKIIRGDMSAAKELGIGISKMRQLRKQPGFPCSQFGRVIIFDMNEVFEYLKSKGHGRKK